MSFESATCTLGCHDVVVQVVSTISLLEHVCFATKIFSNGTERTFSRNVPARGVHYAGRPVGGQSLINVYE
jgi:hypothetical protein